MEPTQLEGALVVAWVVQMDAAVQVASSAVQTSALESCLQHASAAEKVSSFVELHEAAQVWPSLALEVSAASAVQLVS